MNRCTLTMARNITMVMTMMMLTVLVTVMTSSTTPTMTSSQQLLTYRPIWHPNGTQLCAYSPTQSPELFDVDKLSSCALMTMKLSATLFNYVHYPATSTSICEVYQSPPGSFQSQDYCVGYELVSNPVSGMWWPTVTVEGCSLPFTFNGVLYEQCVHTVSDGDGPCDKYACVLQGRQWAHCISPTDNKLNKSMVNVTAGLPFHQHTYELPAVGQWLVVQQRLDSIESFDQQWLSYMNGFGQVGVDSTFWLGLEAIHQLTYSSGYTRMRIEMYADDNAWYSAEYDHFRIGNSSTKYQLSISDYSGDAGNYLQMSNGRAFSTSDSGNQFAQQAELMEGGWWYSGYDYASLNGASELVLMPNSTGFYWNSASPNPPPSTSDLVGVKPGRLLISRIMITRP